MDDKTETYEFDEDDPNKPVGAGFAVLDPNSPVEAGLAALDPNSEPPVVPVDPNPVEPKNVLELNEADTKLQRKVDDNQPPGLKLEEGGRDAEIDKFPLLGVSKDMEGAEVVEVEGEAKDVVWLSVLLPRFPDLKASIFVATDGFDVVVAPDDVPPPPSPPLLTPDVPKSPEVLQHPVAINDEASKKNMLLSELDPAKAAVTNPGKTEQTNIQKLDYYLFSVY
ncbi:hypothetical protein GCK72_014422 [Caenorhabditis remanei]|uniref:Uncharacterized protein n=1 Tax=Caenorhabditis remanei TaxID=31234 RepID=A0A6A5GTG0_CAERE|nr:hypothetical protein GCK72_014422 [Caenorhabditis remanei]KAF1757964.1 hypothetical protein GCK72_014422 [Caenorhabditis remanei]